MDDTIAGSNVRIIHGPMAKSSQAQYFAQLVSVILPKTIL